MYFPTENERQREQFIDVMFHCFVVLGRRKGNYRVV